MMAGAGLSFAEWVVLEELHIHDQHSDTSLLVSDLVKLVADSGTKITARETAKALGSLFDQGYVQRSSTPSGDRKWQITTSGSGYMVGLRPSPTSSVPEETTSSSHAPSIPASDRTVALDHNSAEYQEATSHLDNLVEAVQADRSNDFEDKDQRLAELKAGRELLNSSTANPTRVEAVLYGCLAYLATKFADEPIGALAVATWTAIKTLFGL